MERGFSGANYDRWSSEEARKRRPVTNTPINKIQKKFWETKQVVAKKLGKEEDEHIVASDIQLDSKLELFRSINETTEKLQKLIEDYQETLLILAGEENLLGRFLKEEGKNDPTKAGSIMIAAGKTMSYTGQFRLIIRKPLARLYQEVDTFRRRAIEDMAFSIDGMEKSRNEYRGALLWMKNVSTELDPDTYVQLDKFRRVQIHVRDTKSKFDKQAVDCLQKIDLLAASRCNMFSYALIQYQNSLVAFWEKTGKTMNQVNTCFQGYQHYEFTYIKKLDMRLGESENSKKPKETNKDQKKTKKTEEATRRPSQESCPESNLLDIEGAQTMAANNDNHELLGNFESIHSSELSVLNEEKEYLADLSFLTCASLMPSQIYNENSNTSGELDGARPPNEAKDTAKHDDMKQWLNLLGDLDPLANADGFKSESEKQCI